jgi:hypothetical protein
MSVVSLASIPGLSSLANVGSVGNGNSAVLTQKLTGTTALVGLPAGIGTATAVPASASTATGLTTPGGTTVLNQEALQIVGGTPQDNFNFAFNPLSPDAYRFGQANLVSSSGDPLNLPRTLGELDVPPETLAASIGLYTQVQNNPAANPADGSILTGYSRFFLQSVTESQQEKFQIVETFTSYYPFFFGKRPPIYSFRGSLINDYNHKWTNDLMFFYENFFRGTQSVQLGAQAVLNYDGRIVYGFILNLNIQQTSDLDKGAAFSFDLLVMNHTQTYYSADIESLIATAQQFLSAQQARIQSQIKSIGLNPSSSTAYRVGGGLQNPNATTIATSPSAAQSVDSYISGLSVPKASVATPKPNF